MYIKEINKTIKPIVDEFKNILKRDWISGANDNSFGNVGITFEREIGKSPDSMYFPDFYGVEVKFYSNKVIIDKEAMTVYLEDADMSLDVGSIAKGYAVQHVLEYCKNQGMNNILFSVGGNIAGLGGRADGTNFKIAIYINNPQKFNLNIVN